MATPRDSRSNIRAGIAVLAGVTLLALAIWGWNALQDTRRMKYVFWFRAAEGVYGLRVGSLVTIGGVKHGEVIGISPPRLAQDSGEDASALHFRVEIAIDPEVRLYSGVKFHAVPAGVGGDSIIEIYSVGRPTLYSSGVGKDSRLPIQGDRMEAQPSNPYRQWFGTGSSKRAEQLMTAWFPTEGGNSLRNRLESIFWTAEGAPEDPDSFDALRTRADDTWEYVSKDFEAWRASYEQTKASIQSALDKLGESGNPGPGTVRESWAAIAHSWETTPAFPPPSLDAAKADIAAIDQSVSRIEAQVRPLLEPGSFVARDLGETGAQGSLTLQEFNVAKSEAIRSPWRLLERPDAAYLAADHRREAARLYAEAATEHRWVLKSIEEALRRDAELLKVDADLAALLRARFEAANAAFEERRRQAEDLLLGPERPAAAPK